MKRLFLISYFLVSLFSLAWAQQRRPIDNEHPMWMIHIDVWNSADPQKIIDLIPEDIRPYVCMNLSLSCQFDTATSMYRTSWAGIMPSSSGLSAMLAIRAR